MKIHLNTYGGLGNQIFQLAAAIKISQVADQPKIVISRPNIEKYKVKRNFGIFDLFDLDQLNIDIKTEKNFLHKNRIARFYGGRLFSKKIFLINDKNFSSCNISYENLSIYMDGYFQSAWQQNDLDEIRLKLKNSLNKNYATDLNNNCGIHIRGGDFIKLGWNKITKDYYHKSINLIKKQSKNIKFIVYTDDQAYASSIMAGCDVQFKFSDQGIFEDFFSFGSHKYKVLSASSFAFWSCTLGNVAEPINYVPTYHPPFEYLRLSLPYEKRIEV